MPLRLIPISSAGGPVVSLHRPVLLVGRHPDCDVRLDLPSISRRHCCLAVAYERLIIRDFGSRNGVRVNGERVDERHLEPNDEIAIGPLIFRLEQTEAPAGISDPAVPESAPLGESAVELEADDFDEGDLVPLSVEQRPRG